MSNEKTFKVTIHGYGEWIIHFPDTSWFTEEYIKEWQRAFYPYDELREFAEHIAHNFGVLNERYFIEGYGRVRYGNGGWILDIDDAKARTIGKAIIKTSYLDSPDLDIDYETEEI